jgi:3-methyladenine DNA glycosylase AlkD
MATAPLAALAEPPPFAPMTHPLIAEVRAALETAADPVKAPKMQAYMKSTMPYRGVSSPDQKAIWKIGWALRQYAWTNPREAKRYVKANHERLSNLSLREALKNI